MVLRWLSLKLTALPTPFLLKAQESSMHETTSRREGEIIPKSIGIILAALVISQHNIVNAVAKGSRHTYTKKYSLY